MLITISPITRFRYILLQSLALPIISDMAYGLETGLTTNNNAPVVGNHGKLGPCPRPWRGGGTAHEITATCLIGLGTQDPRA